MRFRTLHEADAACELGGESAWEVGYCTTDGLYHVDTQDALDAARCIPPVRLCDTSPAPVWDKWTRSWGFA